MVVQQARSGVTQDSYNDTLDAWREQVEQARRGHEASWSLAKSLARQSADAYEDFLDSLFFYYGENARAAEKGTTAVFMSIDPVARSRSAKTIPPRLRA
jgi:hypothetical protein